MKVEVWFANFEQFYVNINKNATVEEFTITLESQKAKILIYVLGETFNDLHLNSLSNDNFTIETRYKSGIISEEELSNYDSVIFINGYKGDLSSKEVDEIYKYYLANHSIALVGGANNSFSEGVNKIANKFGVNMRDRVKTSDCIKKNNAQFVNYPIFNNVEVLSFGDNASKISYTGSSIKPMLKVNGNNLMAFIDKSGTARVLFDSNARHYGFRSSNRYCSSNNDDKFIKNLAEWLIKDYKRINNISVYLLNYPDKEFSKESISKEIIKLNTSKINDFLNSCSESDCKINFTINSTSGRARIDSIIVKYYLPAKNINIGIYNESFDIKELNRTRSHKVINFKSALNNSLNRPDLFCLGNCKIRINVSAENAELLIGNINVRYKYYDLKADLLDKIIDCWNRGDRGKKKESFICEQFSIPKDYKFREPIDEKAISDMLKERKWCHIIQNSDFGCGTENNIQFNSPIKFRTNIMVRYDGKKRSVIVE